MSPVSKLEVIAAAVQSCGGCVNQIMRTKWIYRLETQEQANCYSSEVKERWVGGYTLIEKIIDCRQSNWPTFDADNEVASGDNSNKDSLVTLLKWVADEHRLGVDSSCPTREKHCKGFRKTSWDLRVCSRKKLQTYICGMQHTVTDHSHVKIQATWRQRSLEIHEVSEFCRMISFADWRHRFARLHLLTKHLDVCFHSPTGQDIMTSVLSTSTSYLPGFGKTAFVYKWIGLDRSAMTWPNDEYSLRCVYVPQARGSDSTTLCSRRHYEKWEKHCGVRSISTLSNLFNFDQSGRLWIRREGLHDVRQLWSKIHPWNPISRRVHSSSKATQIHHSTTFALQTVVSNSAQTSFCESFRAWNGWRRQVN